MYEDRNGRRYTANNGDYVQATVYLGSRESSLSNGVITGESH